MNLLRSRVKNEVPVGHGFEDFFTEPFTACPQCFAMRVSDSPEFGNRNSEAALNSTTLFCPRIKHGQSHCGGCRNQVITPTLPPFDSAELAAGKGEGRNFTHLDLSMQEK